MIEEAGSGLRDIDQPAHRASGGLRQQALIAGRAGHHPARRQGAGEEFGLGRHQIELLLHQAVAVLVEIEQPRDRDRERQQIEGQYPPGEGGAPAPAGQSGARGGCRRRAAGSSGKTVSEASAAACRAVAAVCLGLAAAAALALAADAVCLALAADAAGAPLMESARVGRPADCGRPPPSCGCTPQISAPGSGSRRRKESRSR